MAQLKYLTDRYDNIILPVTSEKAVRDSNGNTLYSKLQALDPIDAEPIVGALPASGVKGKIYRVPGTGSYSDYGWDGTQFVLLATFDGDLSTLVGYYECDTAAATAAKTVAATGYTLETGGAMSIKFTYANSAASPTLSINSQTAKAIYYNGAAASASNTWLAGATLYVYYDGTQYQAVPLVDKFSTGEVVGEVGIDNVPTANSNNLVKSGGVYDAIAEVASNSLGDYSDILENFVPVEEDGFYLIDDNLYIGAYLSDTASSGFGGTLTYTVVE